MIGNIWYVSNVSIIFYCSMLLYYQSWMFYNHFIVILYYFLVLTYWHSAKCCFLHGFYIAENQYQMESKCHETLQGFLWTRRHLMGQGCAWGVLQGEHNPPGCALVGCAHLECPRTASLLYKYPNIPETLGSRWKSIPAAAESRTTRSNLDTITDGVHHLHWCLSDDAWVVLCRPSGSSFLLH